MKVKINVQYCDLLFKIVCLKLFGRGEGGYLGVSMTKCRLLIVLFIAAAAAAAAAD